MESIYDCFKLNNDMKIPCVGFGTYKAAEGNNVEILKTAIEAGYRYFDTASFYQTEEFVGQAIRESNLPREDFFLVSKLAFAALMGSTLPSGFSSMAERT